MMSILYVVQCSIRGAPVRQSLVLGDAASEDLVLHDLSDPTGEVAFAAVMPHDTRLTRRQSRLQFGQRCRRAVRETCCGSEMELRFVCTACSAHVMAARVVRVEPQPFEAMVPNRSVRGRIQGGLIIQRALKITLDRPTQPTSRPACGSSVVHVGERLNRGVWAWKQQDLVAGVVPSHHERALTIGPPHGEDLTTAIRLADMVSFDPDLVADIGFHDAPPRFTRIVPVATADHQGPRALGLEPLAGKQIRG